MRGGAWASEAVNIVKCLLLETATVLVEAGYIRITAVSSSTPGFLCMYCMTIKFLEG